MQAFKCFKITAYPSDGCFESFPEFNKTQAEGLSCRRIPIPE